MWRNTFWALWDKYSGLAIGVALVVIGIVIERYIEPHFPSHLIDELSVALIIAGILTIAVDPFVKVRIQREATRDIFHHMLGFKLPEIIRERLQEIVQGTNLYRENTTIHCLPTEEGDFIRFDVEMEFEIVNPSRRTLDFVPHLQFEKGEQAKLARVICFDNQAYGKGATLTTSTDRSTSLEYKGKAVPILGNGRKRFKYEYSITLPVTLGFWFQNFQYPTIGLSLTIKPLTGIVFDATPATSESQGEWRYDALFMPQQHIDIVWEKTPPSQRPASM